MNKPLWFFDKCQASYKGVRRFARLAKEGQLCAPGCNKPPENMHSVLHCLKRAPVCIAAVRYGAVQRVRGMAVCPASCVGRTISSMSRAHGVSGGVTVPPHLENDLQAGQALVIAAIKRLRACSVHGPVKIVFIDIQTRTTSFNFCPEILELGSGTSDANYFRSDVRPLGIITPDAAPGDISMRPLQALQDAQHVWRVLARWLNWLADRCEATRGGSCRLVLAGHNIRQFDGPILANWLYFSGAQEVQLLRELDTQSWLGAETAEQYAGQLLAWPSIDTLTEMARPYIKAQGVKGTGMQDMITRLGIEIYGQGRIPELRAHRALGDVLGTIEVFRSLAKWELQLDEHCSLSLDELAAELLERRQAGVV